MVKNTENDEDALFQIIQDVRVKAVEVDRYPDVLLVYYQVSGGNERRVFMYRKDFEKLSGEKPLAGLSDLVAASLAKSARVTAFSKKTVEELDTNGFINFYNVPKWEVKWGEALSDDMILMGFDPYDYSYYDMDGSRHVHPIAVSPCQMMGFKAQDIGAAIEMGEIPGVRFNTEHNVVDYVPGNGYTVYAAITLTSEEFIEYKSKADSLKDYYLSKEKFKDYFVERSASSYDIDEEEDY